MDISWQVFKQGEVYFYNGVSIREYGVLINVLVWISFENMIVSVDFF